MADSFAGTWTLTRLALRRDRIMLPAWILGFAGMAGFSASATVGLLLRVIADIIPPTEGTVKVLGGPPVKARKDLRGMPTIPASSRLR